MGVFNQLAVKEKLKARVAIDGPTGAGKSWTMLQWATILAGGPMSQGGAPIGVVDTENRSAAYYAASPGQKIARVQPFDPPYEFFHLAQRPPYDPRQLAKLIDAAEDDLGTDGVLCIDSLTHYWTGEGGTLQIVDDKGRGNSFVGWSEGTPAQRMLIDRIIHAPFHVITTMRSKMEYRIDEVQRNGKTTNVPVKIGLAPEQRAGIEYEFTVVADMDLEHTLTVSKTRCDLIDGTVAHAGRSFEVAQTFRDWLGTGVAIVDPDTARALIGMFGQIPEGPARIQAKQMFASKYGSPDRLREDLAAEAADFIATMLPPAPAADQPLEFDPIDMPVDPSDLQEG